MNGLILRLIALVVLMPVAIIYAAADKKKRIETYNISAIEKPVMASCSAKMGGKKVTFKKGASVNNGCACIAKHAAATFAPERLDAFRQTLGATLDVSKKAMKTEDKVKQMEILIEAEKKYSAIMTSAKMGKVEYSTLLDKTFEFIATCGQRETHKGESLARIAAMTPVGQPAQVVNIKRQKKSNKDVVAQLR